jgi:hypothetical protein
MAHIQVPDGLPGILGPMAISPESTKVFVNWWKYCCVARTP